jgi:hypothetical protein
MKANKVLLMGFMMMAIIAQTAQASEPASPVSKPLAFKVSVGANSFVISQLMASKGVQNGQNVLVVTNMVIVCTQPVQNSLTHDLFGTGQRTLEIGDTAAFQKFVLQSMGLQLDGIESSWRIVFPGPGSAVPFTAVFKKPQGHMAVNSP